MSYCAEISFVKVKPDDLEDFFGKIKTAIREHVKEIADDNCVFSPFGKNPRTDLEFEKRRIVLEAYDWTERLFTYRFFFIGEGEEKVLAVAGVPDSVKYLFDTTIFFQNSTDTDYDYETWDKVPLFKRLVEERLALVKKEGWNWTEYRNKSDCYDIIWKLLDDKVFGSGLDVRLFCMKSDSLWISTFVGLVKKLYETNFGS